MIPTIGIRDGSFGHQGSMTLGGERSGEEPTRFHWRRTSDPTTAHFFTDICLAEAGVQKGYTVAWLVEPPSLRDNHYRKAVELVEQGVVDKVFTFWKDGPIPEGHAVYYQLGGSWIKPEDWWRWGGDTGKFPVVSLIATQKQKAPGHKMRHAVARRADKYRVNVWGRGYRPDLSKVPMLEVYQYSIVIESCRVNGYFSEKLIDALAMGCIPIYWGCPDLADYGFDMRGIVTFETLEELWDILSEIGAERWESLLGPIRHNQGIARWYALPVEDRVAIAHPWVLDLED